MAADQSTRGSTSRTRRTRAGKSPDSALRRVRHDSISKPPRKYRSMTTQTETISLDQAIDMAGPLVYKGPILPDIPSTVSAESTRRRHPVQQLQSMWSCVAVRKEMDGYQPPWMAKSDSEFIDVGKAPDSWSPVNVQSYFKLCPRKNSRRTSVGSKDVSHALDPLPFDYSPLLEPDETRVLTVLPGTSWDFLEVQLQHITLSSGFEYTAVSYAWGSKSEWETILCDRFFPIKVPTSLSAALRRLRHESEPRVVWADAVCINQNDDVEKGHQVRLMRSIFQKAQKVSIWLGGDGYDIAEPVFELLGRIYRRDFRDIPPPDDPVWSWVAEMFRASWFTRLWCLQEVALAQTAEVLWGAKKVPWKHLAFTGAWVRSVPAPALRNNTIIGLYNACLMHSLSNEYKSQSPVSFLQLLTLSRQFFASDSRDKVYGLLGIPTRDSDPDQGVYFLEPDYTKTLSEVYMDSSKKIIESSGSLRILSYVQHAGLQPPTAILEVSEWVQDGPRVGMPYSNSSTYGFPQSIEFIDGLPSWVPRWHQYFARTLAPPEDAVRTFSASQNLNQVRPMIKESSLIVSGFTFSTVTEVSGTMGRDDPRLGEKRGQFWRNYFPAAIHNGLGVDPLEMMGFTITAGKDWFGALIENAEQHTADFLDYLGYFCPWGGGKRWMGHSKRPDFVDKYVFSPQPKAFAAAVGKAGHFEEAMQAACSERKVFLTGNKFLGLGPQAMERGDIVCILSGAQVPVVLRPCNDKYMLVGEAYVYGIMFGENIQVESQKTFEII